MTRRATADSERRFGPRGGDGDGALRAALSERSRTLVRGVVSAWRRMTTAEGPDGRPRRAGPGARTVVALSGGADSSGLLIALAVGLGPVRARERLVAVHVVHDLRASAEAEADAAACAALCGRLGVELVVERVRVRTGREGRGAGAGGDRNLEARARRLRYGALARAARARGIGFVATAHHADDQLETVLMRLMRGAGARGLAGIATVREIAVGRGAGVSAVRVIRPLLVARVGRDVVGTEDLRSLCAEAGWAWREDATNRDPGQMRAAIRLRVTPVLRALRPGVSASAARSAGMLSAASEVVEGRVSELIGRGERTEGAVAWSRSSLRAEPGLIVGGAIRRVVMGMMRGARADRLTSRALGPVVRAIGDRETQRRTFAVGGARVVVTSRTVRVEGQAGA